MCGCIGWLPSAIWEETYRSLVMAYEAKIYNEWNHTSQMSAQIYNISVLLANTFGKRKVQPRTPDHFHPFRKAQRSGLKIDKSNFQSLRVVANAMMKGKGR